MQNTLAETTLRFWKASLAWKNIDNHAQGWTQGSFIQEVRALCHSPFLVGWRADDLLDDVIHNKEHKPLPEGFTASVVRLQVAERPKYSVK